MTHLGMYSGHEIEERRGEQIPAVQRAPPPCEMESAVYGQCMVNLLDGEVRRNWRKWVDSFPIGVHIDSSRCNYTMNAFKKCMSLSDPVSDPQTAVPSAPEYYWMSSIYWQAPSKPRR